MVIQITGKRSAAATAIIESRAVKRLLTPIRAAVVIAALGFGAGPSFGQSCPPLPDRTDERAQLFEALRKSPDEQTGTAAANAIWQLWTQAPDQKSQTLLDRGMAALRQSHFERSEAILEDLTEYCPDFPEGWNQRAFARYLQRDLEGSVADIERTLSLEPDHFGALAGLALILIERGESEKAKAVLRHAVSVNPWLKERAFLHENATKEL